VLTLASVAYNAATAGDVKPAAALVRGVVRACGREASGTDHRWRLIRRPPTTGRLLSPRYSGSWRSWVRQSSTTNPRGTWLLAEIKPLLGRVPQLLAARAVLAARVGARVGDAICCRPTPISLGPPRSYEQLVRRCPPVQRRAEDDQTQESGLEFLGRSAF